MKGLRPAPRTLKKRKGTFGGQNVPGAGVDDFVPWIPPISSRPPDWKEEEEEDGMSDLSHPDSRSDPNGGSELGLGRETIYWDSLPIFFSQS